MQGVGARSTKTINAWAEVSCSGVRTGLAAEAACAIVVVGVLSFAELVVEDVGVVYEDASNML